MNPFTKKRHFYLWYFDRQETWGKAECDMKQRCPSHTWVYMSSAITFRLPLICLLYLLYKTVLNVHLRIFCHECTRYTNHKTLSFCFCFLLQRPSTRLCPSPLTWPALFSTAPTLLWRPTVVPLCFSFSAISNVTSQETQILHWTTLCAGSTTISSLWSIAVSLTLELATHHPSLIPPPPAFTTTACGWPGKMSARSDPIRVSWSAACLEHSVQAEHWTDCWDWLEKLWTRPRRQHCPESVDEG